MTITTTQLTYDEKKFVDGMRNASDQYDPFTKDEIAELIKIIDRLDRAYDALRRGYYPGELPSAAVPSTPPAPEPSAALTAYSGIVDTDEPFDFQPPTVPSAQPDLISQLLNNSELLSDKEADKIPCTGGRTNHEWYTDGSMTRMFCRQCGIKATHAKAQPVSAPPKGGAGKLSEDDLDAAILEELSLGNADNKELDARFYNRATEHLGYACVLNSVHRLLDKKLIRVTFGSGWQITDAGRRALEQRR